MSDIDYKLSRLYVRSYWATPCLSLSLIPFFNNLSFVPSLLFCVPLSSIYSPVSSCCQYRRSMKPHCCGSTPHPRWLPWTSARGREVFLAGDLQIRTTGSRPPSDPSRCVHLRACSFGLLHQWRGRWKRAALISRRRLLPSFRLTMSKCGDKRDLADVDQSRVDSTFLFYFLWWFKATREILSEVSIIKKNWNCYHEVLSFSVKTKNKRIFF